MIKYVVYWILTYTVQTVCPQQYKQDDFGRVGSSNYTTTQLCWRTEKENHSKVFHNSDSAYSFYKKALAESKKYTLNKYYTSFDESTFKIDTIKSDVSKVRIELTKEINP